MQLRLIKIEPNTKVDFNNLEKLLDVYGNREYTFNRQLILDDIQKFEDKYNNEKSKIRKKNLRNIINYLKDIHSKSGNGISVRWLLDGIQVCSVPVQFMRLMEYNVQITDYIIREGNTIVSVDYTNVMNALAFYMTYKATGIELEDLESILDKIGITIPYNADEVVQLINPITYMLAQSLKPVLSEHVSIENKCMYTYYVSEKPRKLAVNYREVLNDTYNITISYILENILSELEDKKCTGIKVAAVYNNSIYIIVDGGVRPNLMDILSNTISLKVFGRNFEINPEVQVH